MIKVNIIYIYIYIYNPETHLSFVLPQHKVFSTQQTGHVGSRILFIYTHNYKGTTTPHQHSMSNELLVPEAGKTKRTGKFFAERNALQP